MNEPVAVGVSPLGPSRLTPPEPEWQPPEPPDSAIVARLSSELSLPASLCAVLVTRGIVEGEAARRFLRPRLEDLRDPAELPDLNRAVARIEQALDAGQTIFVHGDYDVDGVAATALLTRWLRRLGGRVVPFVPHRIRDGYDFGAAGVEAALQAGASLVLTCDSGIRAHDAVTRATGHGLDVIVTDHHTPADTLPAAFAVVNPMRTDASEADRGLCGAGVAWKLCQGLARAREVAESELYPYLTLVAIATIADLVPLTGDNRILVRFGLRYLAQTQTPGVIALLKRAGIEPGDPVEESAVAFRLAPRINAIGRMEDAATALELLLSDDPTEADPLAERLEAANVARRDVEARTLDEALGLLAESFDPLEDFGVVLAHEGWHPGVIGIVASRVVEAVHRPVILVALDDSGRGKGSGRSIPGVHLLNALTEGCAPLLRRFGGHRQAAGIEIEAEQVQRVRAAFNAHVRTQLGGQIPRPRYHPELQLPLEAFDDEFERLLRHLAPFGMGNRRPLFAADGLSLPDRPREVGGGSLKVRLRANGGTGNGAPRSLDAIGFGLARRRPPESLPSGPLEAIFHLERNEYQGRSSLQARLLDLRASTGSSKTAGGGPPAAP